MSGFEDLQNASFDASSLQNYLSDNFQKVYDFFTHLKHADFLASRDELYGYIQLSRNVILQLNIHDKSNLAFISLLLDICEELGLLAPFKYLYDHLIANEYNIGERLKAASLYLINVRTADDYLNRYEAIYHHLKLSSEIEADNTDKVLMTMVNYYAKVIHDFGEFNMAKVLELKSKIENSLTDFEYSFLHNKVIEDVLNVELTSFSDAYLQIHSLLDSFLGRDIIKPVYRKDFLIESGTEYCNDLSLVDPSFYSIKQISCQKHRFNINADAVHYSLQRGTTIIESQEQLFAYMYSYGDMHYSRMIEALKKLPRELFSEEVNIIDWGCGQGLASMAYFDYLGKIRTKQEIKNLTLIEPSEIALMRASLHIKCFSPATDIHTIHNDLDALDNADFKKNKTQTHIHFFSNILDIEKFSLTDLLKLIELNFPGSNYFICVSPYINDMRTSRLDAFVNYFKNKNGFFMIDSIENVRHQWVNGWTRVHRVFKVFLN